MKKTAGFNRFLQPLHITGLLLIAAAVPLFITRLTYSQSDLPKSTALAISGSVFILLAAMNVIFNRDKTRYNIVPLLDIPVSAYFLVIIVSFIFSINKYNSYYGEYERQIGLVTFAVLFFVYISAAAIEWNERYIKRLCLIMEYTAVFTAFYALLQQTGIDPFELQPPGDTRPVSTIGNAVFAGGFLATVLPVSAFNLAGKKSLITRYLLPAIIFAGIIVTRTRSAYIAVAAEAVIGVIFALVFYRKNASLKKILLYFPLVIALIIMFIIIFPHNIFSERVLSLFTPQNNPRWLIWRDAAGIFYKYPLTGPGLGNFPQAFSEFYSYGLRVNDVMRYIDNAHNNYLQILCTMGILGLIGFLSVITGAIIACVKILKQAAGENKTKLFYAALLLSITGYLFYGLTNFDEISILLYLTLILILIRSRIKGITYQLDKGMQKNIAAALIFIPAIIFSGYNSYLSIKHFSADMDFLNGMEYFNGKNFKEGINSVNKAIIEWPQNPVYRYSIASEVLKFVKQNPAIEKKTKLNLLSQAADEVLKAKSSHSNVNACDALLSLIYFESGRIDEAERIKEEVLKRDEVNISFRINTAYYYINAKQTDKALEQIAVIKKIGFQSVNFLFLEALYYYSAGNNEESQKYIEMVLKKDQANSDALKLKQMILEKK